MINAVPSILPGKWPKSKFQPYLILSNWLNIHEVVKQIHDLGMKHEIL